MSRQRCKCCMTKVAKNVTRWYEKTLKHDQLGFGGGVISLLQDNEELVNCLTVTAFS